MRYLIVLKDGSLCTQSFRLWLELFCFLRDEVKIDMEEFVGRSGKRDLGIAGSKSEKPVMVGTFPFPLSFVI